MKWIINNNLECRTPSERLKFEQYRKQNPDVEYDVIPRKGKSYRTAQQNAALHLWLGMLAEELNNAGLTVEKTLSQKAEIDWTTTTVKELLWKRMQKLVLNKESTTQLKKNEEIDKVYDHLVRYFAEKHQMELPMFPSAEQLEQLDNSFTSNRGIIK